MKSTDTDRRLVMVYNQKSSRAADVQAGVFDRLTDAGYQFQTLQTPSAKSDEIIDATAQFIQPGDQLITATGDGTANAIANGILATDVPDVQLGFLGYGNFNDMAQTFNTRPARRDPVSLLQHAEPQSVRPLSIEYNGHHWHYAVLYMTMGWTARMADQFNRPAIRRQLKQSGTTTASSFAHTGRHYMASRRYGLLPSFQRADGDVQNATTDILSVNGPIMAKIFRSPDLMYDSDEFLSRDLDVRRLMANASFLALSIMNRMPGVRRQRDDVQFIAPSSVPVQCDGEFTMLHDVETLTVAKPDDSKYLNVLADCRRLAAYE